METTFDRVRPIRQLYPTASTSESPIELRTTTTTIPSLDGIRAISFALVFAGHAGLNHLVPTGFGVTVFFFLSGYLITTLLRIENVKTGRVSLSHFYLRRSLRILPPFYIVLALALTAWAVGLVPAPGDLSSITSVAFHYANYFIVRHTEQGFLEGTGVYWSLAVEEHFYLLFPIAYLASSQLKMSRASQAAVLLASCGAILVWRIILVNWNHAAFQHEISLTGTFLRTGIASDARFDSLLFGCALALFENPALDRSALSDRTWKYRLLPVSICGLLLSFAVRDPEFRSTIKYSVQGISLVPLFVCAIRYADWWPMRLLNFRLVSFVGVLSYSLYLTHLVIIGIVARNVPSLHVVGQGILALVLSLGVSFVIYITVEKPMAMLRRRLHAHDGALRRSKTAHS